jgi:hypothetical protein
MFLIPKFIDKNPEQTVIEPVFGLLDSNKRGRLRVVQHEQVGEHLESSIGHLLREEWIFEAAIIELKQQPTIVRTFRGNSLNARYSIRNSLKYFLEFLSVLAFHVLHEVCEVVAVDAQMPLRASQGQRRAASGAK